MPYLECHCSLFRRARSLYRVSGKSRDYRKSRRSHNMGLSSILLYLVVSSALESYIAIGSCKSEEESCKALLMAATNFRL